MTRRPGFHRDPDPTCPGCGGTGYAPDVRRGLSGFCYCVDRGPTVILAGVTAIAVAVLVALAALALIE